MIKQHMRNNHYVPAWYQKGFLNYKNDKLYYMDLRPDPILHQNTNEIIKKDPFKVCEWHPARCFQENDLYTTYLRISPNDEIERYLFGRIDSNGNRGIRALISNDFENICDNYLSIFEFIDALFLRTPKGLDYLRRLVNFPKIDISQEYLMKIMQYYRQDRIIMWMEGVREIVSAKNSNTKFIISDAPVTIYNYKLFPGSKVCLYPNDPSFFYVGTQTIFPLDKEHCLILTHLDYAQRYKSINPLKKRINARCNGYVTSMSDDWLRTREFNDQEVSILNFIIKQRARKYIAAGEKEWLFPENNLKTKHWSRFRSTLLPKNQPLSRGEEYFVRFTNGGVLYHDKYGQSDNLTRNEIEDRVREYERLISDISKNSI